MKNIISLENISKSYLLNKNKIRVLDNLNINFQEGKFYVIMGHSGSGKSTLINILGLVDNYDNGKYELFGKNVAKLNDKELSYLRMKNIGFIYQDFQLVDTLKAVENVMLPMTINEEINRNDRKSIATTLLAKVNLQDRLLHYPKELSGGEQQRVAIARALANNPNIILGDEPTGNLDEKSEKEIFSILKQLSKDGKCVIVVSHSNIAKKYADKVYKLESGKLVGETL